MRAPGRAGAATGREAGPEGGISLPWRPLAVVVRWALLAAVTAGAPLSVTACSDGAPEGPGSYEVAVRSSGEAPVGAALLSVAGAGIEVIVGTGGTLVFTAPTAGSDPSLRVVALAPAGAEPSFRIEVADRASPAPRIVILEASDGDDQPFPAGVGPEIRLRQR